MKWYFAARTRHINEIKQISVFLESKGETILSDWIYFEPLTPFNEHVEAVQTANRHIVESVLQADIFVLISDAAGTDMFVELGIALAKKAASNTRIYIVGEHAKRSLLQMHPDIMHTATVDDVFKKESISHEEFIVPAF